MTYNVTANRSSFCPHCQQPMPQLRCGVKMYPQAAAVFDAIARAGAAGIDGHDLFEIAWQGKRKPKYGTLKNHVMMIREFLADTDFRIRCDRGGKYPVYRLTKVVSNQHVAEKSSGANRARSAVSAVNK